MIAAGFSLAMAAILAAVLTMGTTARALPLGQGILLVCGLAAMVALVALTRHPDKPEVRRAWMMEAALWGLLFVVQSALCFFAYFMTGWDVRTLLE